MRALIRTATATFVAVILVTALVACTRSTSSDRAYSQPTCSQLLAGVISMSRSGGEGIDSGLQALSDRCSNEYEIAVDYVSNAHDSEFRITSCEELLKYDMRRESVTLLEQDGWCSYGGETSAGSAPPASPVWPDGGLGWDQARAKAGTVQRVCGPLKSSRETEDGTFLNIGRDYPSAERFTFIFWDVYLDPIPTGATLCGRGEIYLYNGVAQMEMQDPRTLEIWK